MGSLNSVSIIGRLGADPEVYNTAGGQAIVSISVATTDKWTDKTTGQKQERTEWHRVKLFGRLAEIARDYLKKGGKVYVGGELRTDKYTDKTGVEKYSTGIIARQLQLLGGKNTETAPARYAPLPSSNIADDDIPF